MNWNILVDYIMRSIVNYGFFTFVIVPEPSPPFPNPSHVFLDLKKTKIIHLWWGMTEFVLSFVQYFQTQSESICNIIFFFSEQNWT